MERNKRSRKPVVYADDALDFLLESDDENDVFVSNKKLYTKKKKSPNAKTTPKSQPKSQPTMVPFQTVSSSLKTTKNSVKEEINEPEEPISQDEMFKNFRLRRIVKENHGQEITCCFLNTRNSGEEFPDLSNLLATCGGAQASVYDNEHCGDHLDIMSNFDLKTGTIKALCWLRSRDDALLAVGGSDCEIKVLSVAKSLQVKGLSGHSGCITELQQHPKLDNILLSIGSDSLKLWDLSAQKCLFSLDIKANCASFDYSGEKLLVGTKSGKLVEYKYKEGGELVASEREFPEILKAHNNPRIDYIRCLENFVVTKSENGKIVQWSLEDGQAIKVLGVRGGTAFGSKFDVCLKGEYLCCGNNSGIVYIFRLSDGAIVDELQHKRVSKPIKCCAFTKNLQNIIFAGEDPIVYRFDYISKRKLAEWESSMVS